MTTYFFQVFSSLWGPGTVIVTVKNGQTWKERLKVHAGHSAQEFNNIKKQIQSLKEFSAVTLIIIYNGSHDSMGPGLPSTNKQEQPVELELELDLTRIPLAAWVLVVLHPGRSPVRPLWRDVCPNWQWHRTGSRWFPVRTLPVAPLWCDLGFVPNSRGNKAAANLRPNSSTRPGARPDVRRISHNWLRDVDHDWHSRQVLVGLDRPLAARRCR